jgi:hypothetical protein
MKSLYICLSTIFLLVSCVSKHATNANTTSEQSVVFSRYISITTCYQGQEKCIGPVVKNLESANVEKRFERFYKGYEGGLTTLESNRIEEYGIPFNSEVRITKKDFSDTYYVYMMLRSGPGTSRNGVIKSFEIKSLSSFNGVNLIDKPIKFKDGELRAELTFGPPLKLSK